MKTVQETLRGMDVEELALAYLERVPISVGLMERTDDISAKALLDRAKGKIYSFIGRMRTVPIKETDSPAMLFVYEAVKDFCPENQYGLVHLDELEKDGLDAKTYAYEFCEQAEIAGFFVSDAKRTQDDLLGLMTDVLFEASFFGLEQERLAEEKAELDRRVKEINSPGFVGIPAEEVFKELGIEEEVRSEEEKMLEREYWDKMIEYDRFLFRKALGEAVALLNIGKGKE